MALVKLIAVMTVAIIGMPTAFGADSRMVTTIGIASCSTWLKERAAANAERPLDRWPSLLSEAWVHGFLTAMNVTLSEKRDVLGKIDAQTIHDFIDRYCAKNPKNNVLTGAIDLYEQLAK